MQSQLQTQSAPKKMGEKTRPLCEQMKLNGTTYINTQTIYQHFHKFSAKMKLEDDAMIHTALLQGMEEKVAPTYKCSTL